MKRFLALCGTLALAACQGGDGDDSSSLDQTIRLNQIQNLGTHNSFHPHPAGGAMVQIIAERYPFFVGQAEYRHAPLPEQLASQGMRHFELDVFADPEGGNFSHIPLLANTGEATARGIPELDQPGFKVLHLPQIDPDSHCWTLVQCLEDIRSWSDAHPDHLPIMVMIETKFADFLGLATYIPIQAFTDADYEALDQEILSVFPRERLITPADVQGAYDSLEQAVLDRGWPTLAESRGKILFTQYHGHADLDLSKRLLFPDSRPGQANAAFVVLEDAVADFDQIKTLVEQGYLVRTRSDIDLKEAKSRDYSRFEKALASGAQFISTDIPRPYVDIDPQFHIALPDGLTVRCNPVNAPPGCQARELEKYPIGSEAGR